MEEITKEELLLLDMKLDKVICKFLDKHFIFDGITADELKELLGARKDAEILTKLNNLKGKGGEDGQK